MRRAFAITLAVAAVVFIVGGSYALFQGREAYNDVRDRIVAQHIITSEDSAIPGVLVSSADTAIAQADVIEKHASAAVTEMLGKDLPYADIPHENATEAQSAARGLLQQAAGLRSALYGTAVAFKLAQLVEAIGLAFAALGLLLGFSAVVVVKRPA